MRSFQDRLSDFTARGLRVAAICVDAPEINKRNAERLGISFPFLSDTSREVLRRYHLLHPGGGPNHSDIAKPAEMLIDSAGTVRAVHLTRNATVRAHPEQLLREWDAVQYYDTGERQPGQTR